MLVCVYLALLGFSATATVTATGGVACSGDEAGSCEAADDSALLQVVKVRGQEASLQTSPPPGGIPLNYVRKCQGGECFQGMAMELGLPGVTSAPQQMLVDLGSSTMAFCDASLAKGAAAQKTDIAQCKDYGNVTNIEGCPYNLYMSYFYGSVYKGDVEVINPVTNGTFATMKSVTYTIMEMQVNMTCELGFEGIFGVAFDGMNSGHVVPGRNASVMLHQCKGSDKATCLSAGFPETPLPSPIIQSMAHHDVKQFGFYVDYGAIEGLAPGLHKELGAMYFGKQAETTPFFHSDAVTFKTYRKNTFWDFALAGVTVKQASNSTNKFANQLPVQFCMEWGNCIFDSGNPSITLPKGIYEEGVAAYADGKYPEAAITFYIYKDFESRGFETVSMSLPVSFLIEQYKLKQVRLGETVVFGLPTFKFYYAIFNDQADTISVSSLV